MRESQLYRYIRGDNTPSLTVAVSLAQAGGVSLEWLAHGGPGESGGGVRSVAEEPSAYTGDSYWVRVPRIDGEEPPLLFRGDWLAGLAAEPPEAVLAVVPDDTMEPTLNPGDLVLADRRRSRVSSAGLYLFDLGGHPGLRRAIPRPEGPIHLRCDNPAYPEQQLSRDEGRHLTSLGRVLWTARRLG